MKYLIDHQLPRALALHLRGLGADASHVLDWGLNETADRRIWRFAFDNGFVVVSKDEDFLHLAGSDPNGPPFVWVRLGNCRKPQLFGAFDRVWPRLEEELARGAKVVEIW